MRTDVTFPTLSARNLEGLDVTVPDTFEGERNIVLVAFDRQHQELVDSWISWLEEHAAGDPGLRFYELPTIGRIWAPIRNFIDGGMAAAIREPVVLRRTLTIYGDVTKLTAPLGIKDRSTIALFLVDRAHTVRWAGRGQFNPDTAEDLERALRID